LGRAKLAAIAVSVVAFVGALVGVVQASPNAIANMQAPGVVTQQGANSNVAQQFSRRSSSGNIAPLVLPQAPQMPTIRPFVRSRGS
jgi:hypothetical protein